ncbi:MAG: histidine--tRNA ligase [Acidiferrobacteraceae bacterium]|nr:histidine--tRNA ligase [Acidiferrobacteraceae bacterium]
MNSGIIQSVRGMNDILPTASETWRYVEQTIHEVVALYGYGEIRTPIVEKTELFSRSIGEQTDIVEKEMYTFVDRNQDSLTLRPEGTASCIRAGISHGLLYNSTQRWWYLGPMFRHERPQKGRYRQFHQFGVEAIGWPGPDIDSEVISLGHALWRALGLVGLRLEINTLGSLESRRQYTDALKIFLSDNYSDLDEASTFRLDQNPLRILDSKDPNTKALLSNAPVMGDYLTAEDKAHFDLLCRQLDILRIDYHINNRLVRGLDYYTGAVFEWIVPGEGSQNSVCGGGRYDNLVQQLGGSSTPAAGFACGLERLINLVEEQQNRRQSDAVVDIWMVLLGESATLTGHALAEDLRRKGMRVICNCGGGTIGKQLRRADQSGAHYAVIIGDKELESNAITIKGLRIAEEQSGIPLEKAVDFLDAQLKNVTTSR